MQGRKLCPCVVCRYGWMDNFYVDRDFINFSAIKAPPGSTTEILFDWESKEHWSELQVTLKLPHCSLNVHFFCCLLFYCFIFSHSYCLGVSLRVLFRARTVRKAPLPGLQPSHLRFHTWILVVYRPLRDESGSCARLCARLLKEWLMKRVQSHKNKHPIKIRRRATGSAPYISVFKRRKKNIRRYWNENKNRYDRNVRHQVNTFKVKMSVFHYITYHNHKTWQNLCNEIRRICP